MSSFRRVDADAAGPTALGILVPPGQRTMIVVRPRSLDWDLLPARPLTPQKPAPAFLELHREEAITMARKLALLLEGGNGDGLGRVVVVAAAAESGYWVQAEVGALMLLACRRRPGEPYRPLLFATHEEATSAAQQTAAVLFPPPGAEQELYFNLRNFAR
jgi:hypothetical protein